MLYIVLLCVFVLVCMVILAMNNQDLHEHLDVDDTPEQQATVPVTEIDKRVLDVPHDPSDFLILVTAQCIPYHDFQSLAAYDRIRKIWPEATVLRLLHCTPKDRETYKYMDIMPSEYTSDCSVHPRTGDNYAPLNRPVAIQEFFEKHPVDTIKQTYIVVLDADIILNRPLNYFPVQKGEPVGQLASILVPRMHTAATTLWPDADLSRIALYDFGCPYILHKDDLALMAPYWVKFTNMLRENDTSKKRINWICEMYSYILAAAQVGLVHKVRDDLQARWPFEGQGKSSFHYDLDQRDQTGHEWSKRNYMHDIIATDELMTPKVIPNEPVRVILDSINESLVNYRARKANADIKLV